MPMLCYSCTCVWWCWREIGNGAAREASILPHGTAWQSSQAPAPSPSRESSLGGGWGGLEGSPPSPPSPQTRPRVKLGVLPSVRNTGHDPEERRRSVTSLSPRRGRLRRGKGRSGGEDGALILKTSMYSATQLTTSPHARSRTYRQKRPSSPPPPLPTFHKPTPT
jgi:hypothetical protein